MSLGSAPSTHRRKAKKLAKQAKSAFKKARRAAASKRCHKALTALVRGVDLSARAASEAADVGRGGGALRGRKGRSAAVRAFNRACGIRGRRS